MKFMYKFDCKMLLTFVFLLILSIFYVYFQIDVNNKLRVFFEWEHLSTSLWLFSIISYLIHYISSDKTESKYNGVIFEHFGVFADSAFSAITFGLASTTSAAILKGVYIQKYFGDEVYFQQFDDFDIYSMLVVCLFLFGYSVFSCSKPIVKAIYIGTAKDVEAV